VNWRELKDVSFVKLSLKYLIPVSLITPFLYFIRVKVEVMFTDLNIF